MARRKPRATNLQDKAEDREYAKGKRAGEAATDRKFRRALRATSDSANDPKWYYNSQQILNDTASFSFQKPLGYPVRYDKILAPTVPTGAVPIKQSGFLGYLPGVMSLTLALTPGISTSSQSPVNLAATNVYSFVRHKNSGSRNYDSPDLMLYLLSMDSIYACWKWMQRLYGMASVYSATNRYQPQAWFALNNVDFEDIISNLADFRAWLNVKSQEIAAFAVPADFKINKRHAWLFENIYKDADTERAQQYMYVPAYFYKYSETTASTGGELLPQPVCMRDAGTHAFVHSTFKLSDLKQLLNSLLDAVNYSEDIGIMSGDILKAYTSFFTLSEIPADYRVDPVYEKEVQTQIENAMILPYSGWNGNASYFNVGMDPNNNHIVFAPTTIFTGSEGTSFPTFLGETGKILNFHWDSPTPEDVVVATRLCVAYDAKYLGATSLQLDLNACGTEVVTSIEVASFTPYATSDAVDFGPTPVITAPTLTIKSVQCSSINFRGMESQWFLNTIAAFDWAPNFYSLGSLASYYLFTGASTDFDVLTVLTTDNIEALHLMATLAEYNVPN